MGDGKVAVLNVVPVDRTGAPQKIVIEFVEGVLARARELERFSPSWSPMLTRTGGPGACGLRSRCIAPDSIRAAERAGAL